jgi:hypothetical protein
MGIVLRQEAIHSAETSARSSLPAFTGFPDKIPTGQQSKRGLTFRMAQTPIRHLFALTYGALPEG